MATTTQPGIAGSTTRKAASANAALAWTESRRKFIEAGGQTTQSFGLGRIIGQIYALLYLSPQPMCLDDIAGELGVSKASVSTTVRQLQGWAAVKPVWVKGDRKDYYEAETDFNILIKNGLLEILRKKLNTAGVQLGDLEAALTEANGGNTPDTASHAGSSEELRLIAERFLKAKQLHGRLSEIVTSPLIEQIL